MWGPRIGVFDLETTGVDVDTSRIVSACVAVLDADGQLVARWDWLADPGIPIPEGASAVHGITTERARRDGRQARVVVAEITQALRVLFATGVPVVVYNAPYDLTLLDRECRRHGLEPIDAPGPVIDPLVIDKTVDRYRKGKRTLEVAAAQYQVALDGAHDAGADAIAAGRVAWALLKAFPDELDIPLADLHGRQEIWFAEHESRFRDYLRSVKGDDVTFEPATWPLRPVTTPGLWIDTQPLPRPPLRAGRVSGFDVGLLELESGPPIVEQVALDVHLDVQVDVDVHGPTPTVTVAPRVAGVTAGPPVPPRPQARSGVHAASGAHAAGPPPTISAALAAAPPPQRPTVLRVAAGILTDSDGRTLLVRKRGTTSFMQAGGKIEQGESALDALRRELREELGLELDPDHTEYLGSFRAEAANEPNTVIRAEVFALTTDGMVGATGEIEELLWIETANPPGVDLAPLTRDTVLPLWASRRSTLF
jgi:DNA polymerase III epsilon subunit-like protein/8-oxo-dGTP pyrophosphatase MutT (NUDIX family)